MENRVIEIKTRLDRISPTFCPAKWLQVTIDLVHGTTHSCHHPKRHAIPTEELTTRPTLLHNTPFKKQQRELMLRGKRPEECQYCWDIEDCSSSLRSDRIIKSADPWAAPHLERLAALSPQQDVNPTYVELMLDDKCNLSCMYCLADISTSIDHEMRKYGPYNVTDRQHRMPESLRNPEPFLTAFWRWLPEIYPQLHTLRVTGGEPLLSPHLDPLLQHIETNPNENLEFVLNSHLNHSERLLYPILERLVRLKTDRRVRNVDIFTSLDTCGARADYIRSGLHYAQVIRNIKACAKALPLGRVVIMCTFNILSLSSFGEFVHEIHDLKLKYPNVLLDISFLRNPEYLRADIASPSLRNCLDEAHFFIESHPETFSPHERSKIQMLHSWITNVPEDSHLLRLRRDFFRFIREYDRRKEQSFLNSFPEYADFQILCKKAVFDSLEGEAL